MDLDAGMMPSKNSSRPKLGTTDLLDPLLRGMPTATASAAGSGASNPAASAATDASADASADPPAVAGGGTNASSSDGVSPDPAGVPPAAGAAAASATTASTPTAAAASAPAGPGRFFPGRKFPGRGGRGRAGATSAGRGKPTPAGRGSAATPPAAGAAGTGSSTPSGGILKSKGTSGSGTSEEGMSGGSGAGGDVLIEAGIGGVRDPMAVEKAASAGSGSGSPPTPGSPPTGDDSISAAISGPPPIVSMEDLTRADALAKKLQRKAKRMEPAAKKVSWADRAGRVLHAIKEFHSDDAARTVSDPDSGHDGVELSHHEGHDRWAERVKREREMERKFHGKGKGKSRGRGDSGAAAKAEAKAEAEAEAARIAMKPTVSWRRPGPYEDGVVHEDVIALEVESSEAESQGARTRAGLEQASTYSCCGTFPVPCVGACQQFSGKPTRVDEFGRVESDLRLSCPSHSIFVLCADVWVWYRPTQHSDVPGCCFVRILAFRRTSI